jgi:hypothetical protein
VPHVAVALSKSVSSGRALGVHDPPESPIHRWRERTLHQGASTRPSGQGGHDIIEYGSEVASPHPHVIHGQGNKALDGASLDGAQGPGVILVLIVFSFADSMVGAFRCLN